MWFYLAGYSAWGVSVGRVLDWSSPWLLTFEFRPSEYGSGFHMPVSGMDLSTRKWREFEQLCLVDKSASLGEALIDVSQETCLTGTRRESTRMSVIVVFLLCHACNEFSVPCLNGFVVWGFPPSLSHLK